MKIDAMLCDYATVREGLLHVLGGGINRLWREEYPAPLGVTLALLFEVHPTEMNSDHTLGVIMIDEDGQEIGNVTADFAIASGPDKGRPGENLILPLVVPLQQVVLCQYGAYSVEILMADSTNALWVSSPPGTERATDDRKVARAAASKSEPTLDSPPHPKNLVRQILGFFASLRI